jgi:AmiR/NasT family two-component response regulator
VARTVISKRHPSRSLNGPGADGFGHASGAQPRATRNAGGAQAQLCHSTVLLVHAVGDEGESVARAVRRLGCQVQTVWPVPALPPLGFDFALVALDADMLTAAPWLSGLPPLPIVAVVDSDTGIPVGVLRLSNVQAVLAKPCQSGAVLTNLALARHIFNYERRLQSKVAKLEEMLHATRQIEQAKLILMKQHKMRANEAYDFLRRQAMSKQMSVAAISAALVDSHGLID